MAEESEERSELEAKLELPTLGLRRRRRGKTTEASAPDPIPEPPSAREHVVRQAVAVPTAAEAAEAARAPAESAPDTVVEEPAPPPRPSPETITAAPSRPRRRPRLPSRQLPTLHASGRVAAVVTGAVVGLTGVLLVYLCEQGCAVVRNTTSCGGAGVVLLVAIFALMVLEGSALLRAFVVPEPLSTSFLGVGLVAVVTMLFLLGQADRWYMVIVIPLISAAGFVLSWWVTSHFSNDEPVRREPHIDV